jgi:hypothetical protein
MSIGIRFVTECQAKTTVLLSEHRGTLTISWSAQALREMLRMMMWFLDVMNYAFADVGKTLDGNYRETVLRYREEVENAAQHLAPLF